MAKRAKKVDPKIDPKSVRSGSGAVLSRDSKGNIKATLKSDFAGISQASLKESRQQKAGTGDGMFSGGPKPRVGGKQKLIAKSGNVTGGTKKMLKASKRRVNKSAASPQAKRSARKLY